MRKDTKLLAIVASAALAAIYAGACKKSSETERREASEAELRSAHQVPEAERRVIDEKNDYVVAVRREQLELRARLQAEIDRVDKKLAELKVDRPDGGYALDPKAKHARQIDELIERRSVLEQDVSSIDRADEHGWDELKRAIEQDLDPHRVRGRI